VHRWEQHADLGAQGIARPVEIRGALVVSRAAATPARPSRHHGTNIRLPMSANWDAASASRACARVWSLSARLTCPSWVSDMAKL